jgi:hypothetical protein
VWSHHEDAERKNLEITPDKQAPRADLPDPICKLPHSDR